ncbi:uncharacterized protein [Drosophila bipectinata]|uniref:uncharacterized protein n=1 Tax=Drosophila bipectinata TaxID=42026 RepID=UPI0038B3ADC7
MSTMQADPGLSQSFQALPRLPLPTFSGGYSEWAEFYSIFSTIVVFNPRISIVEKLLRLRSCLRESAFEVVRSLEVSDENYESHVNEILGISLLESGSIAALRSLLDKFNAHMRALKNLGSSNQIASCIIVQVLF